MKSSPIISVTPDALSPCIGKRQWKPSLKVKENNETSGNKVLSLKHKGQEDELNKVAELKTSVKVRFWSDSNPN